MATSAAILKMYSAYPSLISATVLYHYENAPIQIYRKFQLQKLKKKEKKKKKKSDKNSIFHTSAQNIDCGYPKSIFWAEIRKIIYTPVNPSFTK